MRILLLTHAFNSLTQRLFVELRAIGHDVAVEFDVNDAVTREAVALAKPDLIIAPFLKRRIPEDIWRRHVCLVVHPGPVGDAGPSALDWAVQQGEKTWGITVLQAEAGFDAGPVWASRSFPMRVAAKSSLYRNEVTTNAVEAVLECVDRFPQSHAQRPIHTQFRPAMRQAERRIDWHHDDSETIIRKINAADGVPGVLDEIDGIAFYCHDCRPAEGLSGPPGTLLARCHNAVARATIDGALWIGHLTRKEPGALKLPAVLALGEAAAALPEAQGYHDIWYDERHGIGYLHFPFYNGAMSTDQCHRLRHAFEHAAGRDTKIIVLMGGPDYWSNGIHLNVIEAAASPAEESWANINAMNDLARAVITCESHITIAALEGNAGAGGVFLALACDYVFARDGIILNPHYKGMGNLYGSEYWTYLLPRRAGPERAAQIVAARLPMGVAEAKELGLIDDFLAADRNAFRDGITALAEGLAHEGGHAQRLAEKALARLADETEKPLEHYRAEELEHMKLNFFGFDPSYHVARYHFVRKVPKARTPPYLAFHRQGNPMGKAAP